MYGSAPLLWTTKSSLEATGSLAALLESPPPPTSTLDRMLETGPHTTLCILSLHCACYNHLWPCSILTDAQISGAAMVPLD